MMRRWRDLLLKVVPPAWRTAVGDDVADSGWSVADSIDVARVGARLRLAMLAASLATCVTQALRGLSRAPVFAATAIFTISIGIGVNVAMLSILDRLLLRPLPFAASGQLVHLHTAAASNVAEPYSLMPQPVASMLRDRAVAFADLAYVLTGSTTFLDDFPGMPFTFATGPDTLLPLLGVRPVLGSSFASPSDQGRERQLLLSWQTWRQRFGAREAIVGTILPSRSFLYRVIGVLPPDFLLPTSHLVERFDGLIVERNQIAAPPDPRRMMMGVVGRLQPGVSLDAARAEAAAVVDRLRVEMPDALLMVRADVAVQPLRQGMFFLYGSYIYLLAAAVSLVWLVASVNLATLMLARGRARDVQSAVHVALGASRRHLAGVAVVEAVVLCLGGAVLAVAVCAVCQTAIVALAPPAFRGHTVPIFDLRLLSITTLLALVAAIIAGLAPARRAWRTDLIGVLRGADRTGRTQTSSGRWLLTMEATVGVLIVAGAVATVSSYVRQLTADPGFDPGDLYVFEAGHGTAAGETPTDRERRVRIVLDTLRTMPGVASVGASSRAILGGLGRERTFWRDQGADGNVWAITEDVFPALGLPIRMGRAFNRDEVLGGARVAVVSESGVRVLWPDVQVSDAIGRAILTTSGERTVVGVVADLRRRPGEAVLPSLFVPAGAADASPSGSSAKIVLRMRPGVPVDSRALARRLNERFGDDRTLTAESAAAVFAPWLERPRFQAILLGTLAVATLMVSAIGLYAIAAFEVARRQYEMGVRSSLGATAGHLRALVLRHVFAPVLTGIAGGGLCAWWSATVVQALIFEVDARSPWLFSAVATILALTALAAIWAPARRAARTDPAVVLR
ncbi:MAG TPA: ABC transporter permease [Vicinamibacterales bacterium]|nr:ABC transporter permease [Vicinamibacterales bacterium]